MFDNNFETKFAQLADSKLQEIAPSLYEARVGFQLIDKDEEDSRGFGVMAFILNNTWVYIPTFFLQGKLKMPALYIKKYDMTVPLNDSWISFVKSNELTQLGDLVGPDEDNQQEDQTGSQLLDIHTKIANEKDSLIDQGDLTKMLNSSKCIETDLMKGLQEQGKDSFDALINKMANEADLTNTIFEHYSPEALRETAKIIDSMPKQASEAPVFNKVAYITDKKYAKYLDESEKETLMTKGYVFKEAREDTSEVYVKKDIKDGSTRFSNPDKAGLYDVLQSDGKLKELFILFPKQAPLHAHYDEPFAGESGSITERLRAKTCYVIDPKSPSKYFEVKTQDILGNYKKSPVEVSKKGNGNITEASLDKRTLVESYRRDELLLVDKKGGSVNVPKYGGELRYKFTDNDGILTIRRGTLLIPNQVIYFTLNEKGQTAAALRLGDLNTFVGEIEKAANLSNLKIYKDSEGYVITSNKSVGDTVLRKNAAMRSLIFDHGIHLDKATHLLDLPNDGRAHHNRYMIKYAGIQSPDNGLGGLSAQESPNTQEERELRPEALDAVTNAANTGLKEVIDTSILSSLAGTSRSLEKISDYLGDLIKAMDRVGKILFLYYWHGEEFIDQFGKTEVADLETKLQDVFNSTGDLVLFLKEKSVDKDTLLDGNQTNLSGALGDS